MPYILQCKVFISSQCQYPPRCPNNYVRALILQQVLVGFDVDTAIEHSNLYICQIGAEPLKFMADLQEKQ